jgi:hypothetical protein
VMANEQECNLSAEPKLPKQRQEQELERYWQLPTKHYSRVSDVLSQPTEIFYVRDRDLSPNERVFLTTLRDSVNNCEESSFCIDNSYRGIPPNQLIANDILEKHEHNEGARFPIILMGCVWFKYIGRYLFSCKTCE